MSNRRKRRQRTGPSSTPPPHHVTTAQKDQQPSGSQAFHWRDHPIVIAALAAVGTFTITSYTFKEIIIPTQIAGLPALKEKVEKLDSDNSKQVNEILSLKKKIETYQYQTLFKERDPFPVALGSIKLGRSISDLEKEFPEAKIERGDDYWTVDLGYGVISQGVYYYDAKSKRISHVLFWLSSDLELSDSFLQDRLEESLGKPSFHPKKDLFQWKLSGYNVYKSDSDRFVIHDSKSRPGYWPES